MLTFGSLFAGCGGMDLGLDRAGLKCAWQVEINDYARRVLEKHWPGMRRHDDARTFPPAGDWSVDCIVGGDPCQENSRARVTKSTRAPSLGAEFIRIVEQLRPWLVLRENPARVRRDAPWPWWRFRNELEALGYAVLPFRLRACCLGADHQRDRLFLLAENSDPNSKPVWLQRRAPDAGQAGETAAQKRERIRAHAEAVGGDSLLHASGKRLEGIDGQGIAAANAGRASRDERRAKRRDDGLSTPRVCRSRDEVPNYVERITALGNAVYPDCAEWIGRRILASVEE